MVVKRIYVKSENYVLQMWDPVTQLKLVHPAEVNKRRMRSKIIDYAKQFLVEGYNPDGRGKMLSIREPDIDKHQDARGMIGGGTFTAAGYEAEKLSPTNPFVLKVLWAYHSNRSNKQNNHTLP